MTQQTIVWIAGTGWDAVPGTDKRLVQALPPDQHVLWIDPPVPVRNMKGLAALTSAGKSPDAVAQNVLRVKVSALPGVTRFGVRRVTGVLLSRTIRRALSGSGRRASAVVVAFPLARFPQWADTQKILYVTDDWLGGSSLMGFSRNEVKRVLVKNLREAHNVAAVSEYLSSELRQIRLPREDEGPEPPFTLLPNGCQEAERTGLQSDPQPIAGLVGQLNERLDLDVLEAVQAKGVRIMVIGPRADRDPEFGRRLDRFLAAANVQWLGRVAPEDLAFHLRQLGVGLTPYADTRFNRASFPLKTLEYLAAGVPVVSTDIPAARWLSTEHVEISATPQTFARNVVHALSKPADLIQRQQCRDFAANHSWAMRARQFLDLLEAGSRNQALLGPKES